MPFLRKYATATHVYIPIPKRGVVDNAVGADWTPASGDVKVSIDGGAAANIGTLPTAIAMGNTAIWDFTIATGEVTGKKIAVTISDSATKAVEDQTFLIETYGHASAEYPTDWSADQTPLKPATAGRTLVVDANGLADANVVKVGPSGSGVATTANLCTNLKTIYDTDYATVYDATNKAFLSKLGNFAMGGSSLALTTGAIACSTITASGAVAFQSTFAVTTSTSLGALSCTTLTASGAVALQSTLTVSGATSLAAVSTSGTVTMNALTVTNATTLTGAVAFGSTFTVTGAFTASNYTGDAYARIGAPVGASISADIAAVQSDTDNIQTRLPAALTADGNIKADTLRIGGTVQTAGDVVANVATILGKFTGITLLAQWLGAAFGKQTPNSTALTEINATGAGSGTFTGTTDSLEAIRDRGDDAWVTGGGGGGTGARLVTITVNDGATALQNAAVRMSQGAESYVVLTNASGVAVFALDDATWTVTITKAGYTFTPTTIIVNGTETATYSMTAVTITPSDPGATTGYVTIRTIAGVAVSGAVVDVEVTRWANGTTGSGITPRIRSRTTDASGYAEFTGVPRLATYRVRVNDGEWTSSAVTADAATTPLTAPIGPVE